MSFKRVDIETPVDVDGYSFEDADGCTFAVRMPTNNKGVIDLIANGDYRFSMYTRDIPVYIKALRAAYEHYQEDIL